MDYVYLYGSSVRMGHKVYIIPILLADRRAARQRARPPEGPGPVAADGRVDADAVRTSFRVMRIDS